LKPRLERGIEAEGYQMETMKGISVNNRAFQPPWKLWGKSVRCTDVVASDYMGMILVPSPGSWVTLGLLLLFSKPHLLYLYDGLIDLQQMNGTESPS
jgi:hypothetical protein